MEPQHVSSSQHSTGPSISSSSLTPSKLSAKNTVKTALIVLEKATDGLNIPGLKGATGSIVELIKIAEKRQQNKEALDELVTYLRRLEDAMITPLLAKQSLGVSSALEGRVRRLAEELVSLANNWKSLRKSHRRILSFINHENYAAEISSLNHLIRQSLDAFSLDSQISGGILVEDIQRSVTRTIQHLLSKEIQGLPHANASYDSISRNNAPVCFEGTRVQVFAELARWIGDNGGPNSCVLMGIAGVGKSTIAQTLAILEEETGRLAATYFFSRDENERNNADLFFCTLAYQLAQHSEDFANRISEALRRSPDAPRKTLANQLKKLIVEPLRDAHKSTSRPVLIILDALDECEEIGASEILQLLLDQLTFCKILITTRPEPHILHTLNSHNRHERLILHEVDSMIVEGDIRRYLEHHLSEKEVQKVIPGCRWRLEEKDLDALVQAAGRLFIIASTADKFIKDPIQRDPCHQLKVLLGGFEADEYVDLSPHTMLDRLYAQVLETAVPPSHSTRNIIQRFQNVVGTLIVLQNPLSPQALAHLLGMDAGSVDAVIHRLQSVIVSSRDDNNTPRVYHPSFPDFITTPSRCKDTRLLIEPPKHHGWLADHCFKIMKRMLKWNICSIPLPDQYLANNEIAGLASAIEKYVPPELVYACSYWAVHLSKAAPDMEGLSSQLESFVSQHLLFWLEVLSLTGNLKFAYPALVLAQRFVISQGASAKVLSILTDGQRFILASHEIFKASALHLYYSALPFTPSETTLLQTYKAEIKHSIKALRGQSRHWEPLLAVLAGHTDHVHSVAFTSDGTRLASGSTDRTIRLWDGITGDQIATLYGHSEGVVCVAFTPDGKRLASASLDKTLGLWNGETGAAISTLSGHDGWVGCVAFAADGERLASGSDDKMVRLWDGIVGTPIATLQGHSQAVSSVAFGSNGKLASGSVDNTIILWDVLTTALIATLQHHSAHVRSVVFSPDGKRLASGSNDDTILLWDAETYTLVGTLKGHSSNVTSVAFAPDGVHLASGSWDGSINLWDHVTGKHQATLKGHSAGVYSVAFSGNGPRLASGSGDKTVRLWDCTARTSNDAQEGHSAMICILAITSDGSRLASASWDKTVKLWNVANGALITTLRGHSGCVLSVAFTHDGARLASGSTDRTVKLWDGASGELITTILGHSYSVNSVAFALDGKVLASGSGDSTIRLWDGANGAPIALLDDHSGPINSLTFSRDGRYLASGSDDKTVILREASAARPVVVLDGHSDAIYCVRFTPDGRYLASGSADKTIRIWDCAAGAHLITLEEHLSGVHTISFGSDGKFLTSQSNDGARRLWDLAKITKGHPTDVHSDSFDNRPLFDATTFPSSPPLQLVKKNDFYAVLVTSSRSPGSHIPICLIPFGSQVWTVVSTTEHIAIGMKNGELYVLDSSQVQLG